jgi:acetyl/propionyl-CoA carboxylase alpha subunit
MNDFLPSVGHLDVYQYQWAIRVDNGFEQGMDIQFIMTRCLQN